MSDSAPNNSAVIVAEGEAKVQFASQREVFYNPVQEFNRDLSILAIRHFLSTYERQQIDPGSHHVAKSESEAESDFPSPNCFEALSASGLRSIRYAKEIPELKHIVANDISRKAVQSIEDNIDFNGDGAVRSVSEGGLLCVTCTDMAVLCGNTPESCYAKYGAVSLKAKSCHEIALRIILQCIEAHANRYGRYIVPLLSLSIDFYCRVFVRVFSSQKKCKATTSKLGHVYQCCGCESLAIQPIGKLLEEGGHLKYKLPQGPPVGEKCNICEHKYNIGGPIWLAPIHQKEFIEGLLLFLKDNEAAFATHERLTGMLTVAGEELMDIPLYYTQDRLTSMVKVGSGKAVDFRSALLNAGYRVSISHANKQAIKTDAPNSFIWDMMRAWATKTSNEMTKMQREFPISKSILSKPQEAKVCFDLHPDANPSSREAQLKRFQVNPERNWGPKTRSTASTFEDPAKRIDNQGKKRKRRKLDKQPE